MRGRWISLGLGVATVAASLGLALAGNPAGAATNACGFSCVTTSFQQPGHKLVLKSFEGLNTANNVISLRPGDDFLPAEDFTPIDDGPIVPNYCTTAGVSVNGLFTNNQCTLLASSVLASDHAYQLAFNPDNGGPKTMCIGTWDGQAPAQNYKARLTPCGDDASSVVIAAKVLPGGAHTSFNDFWLINGASNNFSNPKVLTVQNTDAYQVVRWSTAAFNGGSGIDTQMARVRFGPFN